MYDHRLEIILTAKDVTGKVFRIIGGHMNTLKSQIFSLQGALITLAGGYGVGKLSSSFLDAARTTENFKVRLQVLLGSVEEGNRLLKNMADYASQVPFEYKEIMASATQLAGIMKGGVDEIRQWMPLIGDLAAASGLGIEKTTEQVIRMYSAGAASADLFRERGILAMLGFQAGVSYSAEETRKKMVDAWLKADSQFRGATDKMANTWDGMVSMMSDKWFQFRNMLMDAGLFDALKLGFKTLNDELDRLKKTGRLDEYMRHVAHGMIQIIGNMVTAIGWMPTAFIAVKKSITDTGMAVIALADAVLTLGSLGVARIPFGGLDTFHRKLEELGTAFAESGLESDKTAEKFADFGRRIEEIANRIKTLKIVPPAALPEINISGTGTALSPVGLLYQDIGKSLGAWREYYEAIAEYDARKKADDKEIAEQHRKYLQFSIQWEREMVEERKRLQENLFASDHQVMEAMRIGWGLTWEEIRAGGVNAWEDIGQAMTNVTHQASYAFADWVLGTKNIKEAAKDLAENILRNAINTMIQIGVQRKILSAIQKSSTMEEAAVTTVAMGQITAASTPAAITSSIATSGGSAYAGTTAFAVAIAAMLAIMMSNFHRAARGGVFTRPTFTLFGEEGPEAVVPLSYSKRPEAISVINQISQYMDGGSRRGGGYGGGEGRQPAQNYYITIQALDARSFVELTRDNPNAIVAPFRDQLRGGDKGLRDDIRRVAR